MATADELAQFFNGNADFRGTVRQNEPLKNHTTMNVGGNAKIFLEPNDTKSLALAEHHFIEENVKFFILGGGSNVIISDSGLDAVISTRKMSEIKRDTDGADNAEKNITTDSHRLKIDCGASWGSMISFCKKENLGGFEAFSGLSGTVGGALFMNATCFGLSACDNLLSAEYLDMSDGAVHIYEKNDSDWGYKVSPFQWTAKIILSAVFRVHEGFDSQKAEHCLASRKEKGHFRAPSAGSAFKNDAANGIIAGKVIDECGLKGFSVGRAQIAPWHGNFIINPERKATASDIKNLVERVQKIVLEKKGINLETEIIFVGL